MLRDVFYYNTKPNVHPREQFAENLDDARSKATTSDFWIINEFCDYRNFDWDFDFEFLPDEDVWAEDHNNVWPSQHQKDSGTWLCPKEHSDTIIYRGDVEIVLYKNNKNDNWVELDLIDHSKFDFSWHPDPTDPPFIYKWGCKFFPAQFKHVLEYRVPGATQEKYMSSVVELLPTDCWVEHQAIDKHKFDMSWRPDPMDPPFIYVWGNKWIDAKFKPTLVYYTPGATDEKYMPELLTVLPEWDKWVEVQDVDKNNFDFTWRPDPREPSYIYTWGNKWIDAESRPTLEYHCAGATDRKYMSNDVPVLPEKDRWRVLKTIDQSSFDFTWRPDPKEPPFTYVFGNELYDAIKMPTVMYNMPEGPEIKYVDFQKAKLASDLSNYEHLEDSYLTDYSWLPDPDAPPYIYAWGNQWNKPEDKISVQYVVPGATEYRYMEERATRRPCMDNWRLPDNVSTDEFDFSWEPHPEAPPYIYEFGTQWQKTGGPLYVLEGATEKKYVDVQKAIKLPVHENWKVLGNIVPNGFDFSWHPDSNSPSYVYVFGNQWNNAVDEPTVEYHTPGATQVEYIDTIVATLVADKTNWEIPDNLDTSGFDFSWRPNPHSPPYIHEFGTQWAKTGGPKYVAPGATVTKYEDALAATALPNNKNFVTMNGMTIKSFDYSWHPDFTDEPYIYVFGNQWFSAEKEPTIEYRMPGAINKKYVDVIAATLDTNLDNWDIPDNIDKSKFDFSWHPDPDSPLYIYEFATVWNDRGGPRYMVPGATEYKYIKDIKAVLKSDRTNWEILEGIDTSSFDFSWVPHPDAPAYIYQFGTKTDNDDGPRYITPNNNGEVVYLERIESTVVVVGQYPIETTLDDLVAQHPNEIFWATRKNIDYSTFDFEWRPGTVEVAWELDYVHVFGSPESELTQTYFISAKHYLEGQNSLKFVEELKLDEGTLANIFVKPDMFFVDRSNPESAARFEALRAKYGTRIQKTRYLNSWVDTINRCTNRATTEIIWVLNSELDYSEFGFDYYPNPWQMKMVHVFGTQWSHWGTTFMVNRETFKEDTKYINIIEHLSNLNFVKHIRAKATQCVHDIVMIDHGNKESAKVLELIKDKAPNRTVTEVKYKANYFITLKDIISRQLGKKENFIWICSSVCDYTDFDFSYICDPFAKDNLHVFPSGSQKFGDTFFVDVNKTHEVIVDMQALEDHHNLNFNSAVKAKRLPEPIIVTKDDTHVNVISKITDFPYATIITADNVGIDEIAVEPMNLWSDESKNIIITSTGATRIIVPAEAASIVKKELYDYPYIKRAPKLTKSSPMDIVFLSNGETGADENWEHLLNVTKGLPNRVVRVDGVNGRAAAYHAAAEASDTPWMFTVFAKLKVSPKFDWNWQPDRMQVPKHYIFHAKNPVNGLTYGHQAMIAYNKKLTLANEGRGLDFTLDDEHETVPLISGTAMYNTDPFSTWRTAFREVLKLKADDSEESRVRLDAWLNKAEGDFSQHSIKGAVDADKYFDEVSGDFDALKLSYEWSWLRDRFDKM
jgi:hypothetical protein